MASNDAFPDLVFVDLETTGLNYRTQEPTELAWAVNDGEVKSLRVPHIGVTADPKALEVSRYHERDLGNPLLWATAEQLRDVYDNVFIGKTLVGANVRFDSRMLERVFGFESPDEPWHYRIFEFASWASGVLGADRPLGMAALFDRMTQLGFVIPKPDHSAAGDVKSMQTMYYKLVNLAARNARDLAVRDRV
jgi:hypothetical protein